MNTSDTWSSAIKIEVPIISFFDRVRLSFTPLQIKETEDGTVYYKIDSKGRLYIYDIYLKKKEVRHYAFDTDLRVWAICKYCGGRIGSPTHYCPHCGRDIDRQG